MAGKLAVFNLPEDCREEEVEDLFAKYGKLSRACCRQTRAGDTMAFVEFYDVRDAEDAKRDRHGHEFGGRRLRVELSDGKDGDKGDKGRGKGRRDSRRRDSRRRGRDSRGRGKARGYSFDGYGKGKGGGGGGGGKGKGLRDSYHKVRVSGIPPSASWQDVKDFLRKAAAVKFTDIDVAARDVGIGGFDSADEADRAVRELDGTMFTARDGEKTRVNVESMGGPGGAPPARGRSRSRSRSAPRKDSRSRSR
eukprot:g15988.t1